MRSKNRVAKYFKFRKDIDSKIIEEFIKENDERVKFLRKGIKLFNMTIRFGQDNDDFVRDLVTCVIQFDSFRVPRFVSKYLIKQLT